MMKWTLKTMAYNPAELRKAVQAHAKAVDNLNQNVNRLLSEYVEAYQPKREGKSLVYDFRDIPEAMFPKQT